MLKVIREPIENNYFFRNIIENCCKCNNPTRYWYIEENQPLCQKCALIIEEKDIPKNLSLRTKR